MAKNPNPVDKFLDKFFPISVPKAGESEGYYVHYVRRLPYLGPEFKIAFRRSYKIKIFAKIDISKIQYLSQESKFWSKTEILGKNRNFGQT